MAKRAPADVSMFSKPTAWKKAGGRAGLKAGLFTLVTESVQHGTIIPASLYGARGCCTKAKGTTGCTAPPRPGQVELVFIRRGEKGRGAAPAGPALRFCTGKGKGEIVPVKDPREAKRIALAYQACVGDKRGNVKACVTKAK